VYLMAFFAITLYCYNGSELKVKFDDTDSIVRIKQSVRNLCK